jgi:hypothetical protein
MPPQPALEIRSDIASSPENTSRLPVGDLQSVDMHQENGWLSKVFFRNGGNAS